MDEFLSAKPPSDGPFCQQCGYDLSRTMRGSPCPECGNANRPVREGSNPAAMTSLVLGILALVTGCGLIFGALAIVVGNNAMRAVREGRAHASSAGTARAGVICGWVSLALMAVWLAVFYFPMILAMFSGWSWP